MRNFAERMIQDHAAATGNEADCRQRESSVATVAGPGTRVSQVDYKA